MKKTLFYYPSERVYKDEAGNLYCSGNFTTEVWKRYIGITGQLIAVMRDSGKVLHRPEEFKGKHRINTEQIEVHLVPERFASLKTYFSVKLKKYKRKIEEECVEKSDYVIIRGGTPSMVKLCKRMGKPYVVEVVGCTWDALWNHSWKGKILAPITFLKIRKVVADAPWVLYVTNEFLQKRYPTKGRTIGCSDVSLNTFDIKNLNDRIEKIQSHHGKLVLGTAAAVDVRYKGQEYVIRALAQLKKSGHTLFEYQLAGQGDPSYLQALAKQLGVQDQVVFMGQMSHERVLEWMKNIDVYVQPSLQEGLPRALVEAMSTGLPCIGSQIAGIPELLDKSMLFTKKNVTKIVDLLMRMDTSTMKEQAERNYEKSKEFDAQLLEDKRNTFYHMFVNSN